MACGCASPVPWHAEPASRPRPLNLPARPPKPQRRSVRSVQRTRLACAAVLAAVGLPLGCGGLPAAPGTGTTPLLPLESGAGFASLAPLVRRVTPGVVNIVVESRVVIDDDPLLRDPDFRRFMERFGSPLPEVGETEQRQSFGSGIVVDGARGLILTNQHLLEGADSIEVTVRGGRRAPARLVGVDAATDLALLQVDVEGLTALTLGDSNRLQVGDFVVSVGNPFGLGQSVSLGVVSALDRVNAEGESLGTLIQTDASINPGNSGGPLVDLGGRVVGISTALIGPEGASVGIGFAIPSNRARTALNRLLAGGRTASAR